MRILAPILMLLLILPGRGLAAEVTLTPTRDATLVESATGALANGAGSRIFAGRTNQTSESRRRALIHFDVAGNIPAGSDITGVTLTLTVARTIDFSTRNGNLHRLTADWGEGASLSTRPGEGNGGPSTNGDATWIHRFFSSQFWNTPGGDFAAVTATTGVTSSEATWTGNALVADVQDMLDNPSGNFGWIVIVEGPARSARAFHSRTAANTAVRPRLTVTFNDPTPVRGVSWGSLKNGRGTP